MLQVFAVLQHQPRDDGSYESAQKRKAHKNLEKAIPYINFESEADRKATYELAFSALKYQYVLEDLLEDIAFYIKYPELVTDSPLVTVIFCDYMQRKFMSRELHSGEKTYTEVTEVEQCISECKIKLDASLARRRIKESARSVEDLLPSNIQTKGQLSNTLLTYAWVNLHKTSMSYVITELSNSGYEVMHDTSQQVTYNYFCLDSLFDDTLVFSSDKSSDLNCHRLVQEGCIVLQDKTSLFGPQSVIPLLNTGSEDILLVDSNSGLTAAHLSSLMNFSKKSGHIYLFGIRSPAHKMEVQANLDRMEASNVKVIEEPLDRIDYDDVRLKHVKIALIHGQCSKTAVLDPVSFVITEGEDVSALQDLSLGKPSPDKINAMTRANLTSFRHIIKFPKMQAVIFITRSLVDAENEKVVQRAIEAYNSEENRKHLYRVTPPSFKFDNKLAEKGGSQKYYKQPPTEQANGCFVAMVTKEIENTKEGHQTILQRAAATGLLNEDVDGGAAEGDTIKLKVKKSKGKHKKSSSSGHSKRRGRKPPSPKRVIAFGSSSSASLRSFWCQSLTIFSFYRVSKLWSAALVPKGNKFYVDLANGAMSYAQSKDNSMVVHVLSSTTISLASAKALKESKTIRCRDVILPCNMVYRSFCLKDRNKSGCLVISNRKYSVLRPNGNRMHLSAWCAALAPVPPDDATRNLDIGVPSYDL
ncbi:putative methyltransferase NSUN7 [Watersipora subatra]|uniref:putative methyltransferase NSUN7 n=1 Tax=Watersipora subatra TaxID=2589382 RepID=UPI00355BE947